MGLAPNQLPQGLRWLNRAGKLLRSTGFNPPSLCQDVLLRKASRATGLNDFGDGLHREGLTHLLDALEQEAELTTLGRLMATDSIKEDLIARLKMVDYRKRHPEIDKEEVRAPIFIVGLPRTGTTLLYNLLSQDPSRRVPLSWEVVYPVPPPQAESYATDPRIEKTRKRFAQTDTMVPDLHAIHPIDALLPEECSTFTSREFQSRNYSYVFDIPSYYDWYVNRSQVDVYEAHRRYLQHLQLYFKKDRWLLKAPQHLPFIGDLFKVYGDAQLIQTHRNPCEVIPSMGSLVYHMRAITRETIDTAAIGQEKLDRWSWALDRALATRDAIPEKGKQISDVRFADLMSDPLGQIERLYDHFGWQCDANVTKRMEDFMKSNPRDKHGSHRYTLEMFHLTQEEVRQRFTHYMQRYELG